VPTSQLGEDEASTGLFILDAKLFKLVDNFHAIYHAKIEGREFYPDRIARVVRMVLDQAFTRPESRLLDT
jgi:hypothetical protein